MSEITADGSSSRGYDHVQLSLGRIMMNNFLGGMAWGLGTLIGMTVVFGVIVWALTQTGVFNSFEDIADRYFELLENLPNNQVER